MKPQSIGRRPDGRLNHKPLADYCPGIPTLDENDLRIIEFSDSLEDQERVSLRIREIAAAIRERNNERKRLRKPPSLQEYARRPSPRCFPVRVPRELWGMLEAS